MAGLGLPVLCMWAYSTPVCESTTARVTEHFCVRQPAKLIKQLPEDDRGKSQQCTEEKGLRGSSEGGRGVKEVKRGRSAPVRMCERGSEAPVSVRLPCRCPTLSNPIYLPALLPYLQYLKLLSPLAR